MCGCGEKGVWRSSVLLLMAAPLFAHVVSMSTGELRIDGPLADYELRIPMVEVAQMANPSSILDYIHFDGGHRTTAKCADEDGTYVCHAGYEFATLVPERLGVECKFFEATVPNHVHWLHAVRGANSDQEVFDLAFPTSELRFRPPSRIETFMREFGLGFARAARNWIGLLFILGLAIAAPRSILPFACFLIGEASAILIGPRIPWPMAPRFLEAAMALTVAYLAVEILMASDTRNLAWIVGLLGLFHGLGVSGFPLPYSVAAGVWQLAIFVLLAWTAGRLWARWRKAIAWGLLAVGLAGFVFRLVVK
jgi:HupE / UreJ protein